MTRWAWVCGLMLLAGGPLAGQVKTVVIRETAEYVFKTFSKQAAKTTLQEVTEQVTKLATRYGDDAIVALRKVGPRAYTLADNAGEHGLRCVQLLARYGDDALRLTASPTGLNLCARYGDDAAIGLIRHGEIAETLVTWGGKPAAGALKAVNGQNARRIAMLHQVGHFHSCPRSPELLSVIDQHGDRAAEYLWNHQQHLSLRDQLEKFLTDPSTYLDGAKKLVEIALADGPAQPAQRQGLPAVAPVGLAELPEDAERENEGRMAIFGIGVIVGILAVLWWRGR
jgi:hypothetical protein